MEKMLEDSGIDMGMDDLDSVVSFSLLGSE
jgi:hypothetical protein